VEEMPSIYMTLSAVIGGLALFMYGMSMMTQGLKSAAGSGLRNLLNVSTRHSMGGLTLGTLGGILIHSSATTVMLVGFVNAGLIDLLRSIPVVMGANIGTSLSMQIISFDLDAYSLMAIGLGFLALTFGKGKGKDLGKAVMGFGLLFLGLSIMQDSIRPHRESIQPFLILVDGSHSKGMILGILLATLVTGIIQSSGATVGMAFALVGAGACTSINQIYPIILGAHIGTCATALLGSIGANIDAKRCAVSHLTFNIINAALAVLAKPWILAGVFWSSDDLLRQTANLNTIVPVITTAVLLPLTPAIEKLIRFMVRTRNPIPDKTYLVDAQLDRPEAAILNLIHELQRVTLICKDSLGASSRLILLKFPASQVQKVRKNEAVINEVKRSIQRYLLQLTDRPLSRRQAFFVQYLDRCSIAVERIGDHIESLLEISLRRKNNPKALVDEESLRELFVLYQAALRVLDQVVDSFGAAKKRQFNEVGRGIIESRDTYMAKSEEVKSHFAERQAQKINSPIAGVFYLEYISALDRLVRHARTIAILEILPDFWVKKKKLERVVDSRKSNTTVHQLVDVDVFLHGLTEE